MPVNRVLLLVLATLAAVPACSEGGSSGTDGGTDTGADADTDTDVDTDTDTDTDTDLDTDTDSLTYDGGPMVPCDGEPEEGEICIPGGTYLMGCMPYDDECEDNELPMVEVALSPFFMEEKEATYAEVIEFLNSLGDGFIKWGYAVTTDPPDYLEIWRAAYEDGPPIGQNSSGEFEWGVTDWGTPCENRTIEAAAGGFSWLGAKLFCEWKGKRLPTEAEWEAAARGQTKLVWPCTWHHQPCVNGKYDMCYPSGECYWEYACCIPYEDENAGDCDSPYGVRGMYGNAGEFVLDWLDYGPADDHSDCENGCTDPAPHLGEQPIIKGGSVSNWSKYTRISHRFGSNAPEDSSGYMGARCVRSLVSFDKSGASD